MLLTNLETVPGRKISQHFGLVQGNTIRAKHVGKDFLASIKNIFGGELGAYTELLAESRKEATDRMIAQAQSMGADAIECSLQHIISRSRCSRIIRLWHCSKVINMIIELIVLVTLLALGYFFGQRAEKKHFKSIIERERNSLHLPVVNFKTLPSIQRNTMHTILVSGNVVISIDYFKKFVATLKMLFGGRITSYESLLDRARREALLRMKQQAKMNNAFVIMNTRIETSSITKNSGRRYSIGAIEVLAYGTAVYLEKA